MLRSTPSPATRRWTLAVLCAGMAVLAAPDAQAQVIRCTDSKTGRVTYTNGSCGAGESRVQVQEAPSAEELERDRSQAAAAIERKNQRLAQEESERRAREQQREREARERARADQARQAQSGNGDSPACQQARRRLDAILAEASPDPATWGSRSQAAQRQMEMACLGPQAYDQLQQSRALQPNAINRPWLVTPPRPVPQPPAAPITGCNVFRCYDRNGGVHPIP